MNNDLDVNDSLNDPRNDPRLTAYALGEINGEEAAQVERWLDADLSRRTIVDEIRATAGLLERGFATEPLAGLTQEQRARVIEPAPLEVSHAEGESEHDAASRRLVFRRVVVWGGSLAAAACVAVLVLPQVMPVRDRSDFVARRMFDEKYAKDADEQAASTEKHINLGFAHLSEQIPKELSGMMVFPEDWTTKAPPASTGVVVVAEPESTVNANVANTFALKHADGAALARELESFNQSPQTAAAPGDGTRYVMRPPAPAQSAGGRGASVHTDYMNKRSTHGGAGRLQFPWQSGRARDGSVLADADGDGVTDQFWSAVPGTENYNLITDNPFLKSLEEPLSTFSIDVDTASYSNVRRFLTSNSLPPRDAVRIEEMINYFTYDYEPPSNDASVPFSANVEINAAPWNPQHRLVRIGLRGKDIKAEMRPPTSLVFLIDVSGSMQPAEKLPLVRDGLKLLVEKLNGDDRLAIVTYAGNAGLVMDSVYVNDENKPRILAAIDGLGAGGSTNGAGGLVMAYDVAVNHFIKEGVNRVILCTDGDFNVGVSNESELVQLIENKRKSNVFLSVLGFGTGNYQDAKMEQLANHGNGNFAYIDNLDEAKRTLVDRMTGTLVTIAKDVKIQVEFNPAKVAAYRLIGYENRVLAAQDFNDDRKDAGEIGAGHTVTALYEVVPPGIAIDPNNPPPPGVDELKYQRPASTPAPGSGEAAAGEGAKPQAAEVVPSDDLLTLKLRYKLPETAESAKIEIPVKDGGAMPEIATADFQFAAAVAGFGMILRDSPYRGAITIEQVLDLAAGSLGKDAEGKRAEFVTLVETARAMMPVVTPQ